MRDAHQPDTAIQGFITPRDVAKRFSLSHGHITFLCRTGKVNGIKFGRSWMIEEASLVAFIKSTSEERQAQIRQLSEVRRQEYLRARTLNAVQANTPPKAPPVESKPLPAPVVDQAVGNLVSTKSASEISGYGSDYLARLVRLGKVKGQKAGDRWLIDAPSLRSFIATHSMEKRQRAKELAEARAQEYRSNRARLEQATRQLLSSEDSALMPSASPVSHFAAFGIASFVLITGALVARTDALPHAVFSGASVLAEASAGFAESFDPLTNSFAKDMQERSYRKAGHASAISYSFTLPMSLPEQLAITTPVVPTLSVELPRLGDWAIVRGNVPAVDLPSLREMVRMLSPKEIAERSFMLTLGVGDAIASLTARVPEVAVTAFMDFAEDAGSSLGDVSVAASHAAATFSSMEKVGLKIENTFLGAAGKLAAAAESARLNLPGTVALSVYESLTSLWSSARSSVALLIGTPTPAPIAPLAPSASTTPSIPATPAIVTSYPTYTTVVQGVSREELASSVSASRNQILADVTGMIVPLSRRADTNRDTAAAVGRIEKLVNLTVENGSFNGGTISNMSSISGSSASFTTLSTESASISGSLSITGAVSSASIAASSFISAPYFSATSTTATSTFAGSLSIGSTTPSFASLFLVGTSSSLLHVDATSGYVGIGTSSPSQSLSVSGNGYFSGGLGVGIATTTAGVLQTAGNVYVGGSLTVVGNSTVLGGSSADTLSIVSSVSSNLIPDLNATRDLGSPSFYWDDVYVDNLVANNISAASTSISGTQSETFTINSDNATSDTESIDLIFFRGVVVPNALLSWDAALDRFDMNQPLFLQNDSSTTTVASLDIWGKAGQSAALFNVASSSGTSFLTLAASGKLGIGTTSPAVSLDIYATDAVRLPVGTTAQRPSGDTGFIRYNTTTSQFEGYGTGGAWQSIGGALIDADQDTYITADTNNTDEDHLRLVTAGSERLTITSTGNVGVGTTTPSDALEINTATAARGLKITNTNSAASGANLRLFHNSVSPAAADATGFLTFNGNDSNGTEITYNQIRSIISSPTASSPLSDLVFFPNRNGTLVEALRITGAGSIGIGTTTPWAQLSVNPNGISGPSFAVGSSTKTDFVVTNGGLVGIGTTSPGAKLDITGDASAGQYNVAARFTDTSASANSRNWAIGNGLGTQYGALAFLVSTTKGGSPTSEKLTIDLNGYVGIGTTTPAAPLNVVPVNNAANSYPAIRIESTTSGRFWSIDSYGDTTQNLDFIPASADVTSSNVLLTLRHTNGGSGFVGVGTTSPWAKLSVNPNGMGSAPGFVVGSSTATNFVVTNAGNIGIGLPNPSSVLHISSATANGNSSVILNNTTASAETSISLRQSGTAKWAFGANSSADFFLYNNATAATALTVLSSNSNVGIGTTSVGSLLTLNVPSGGTTAGGQADATNAARTFEWGIRALGDGADNARSAIQFRTTVGSGGSDSEIGFWTNRYGTSRAERMTIDEIGNVGIGTSTPASNLHVYQDSDVWHQRIGGATGELRLGGQAVGGGVIQAVTPAGVARDLYLQRDGGNVGIGTASPGSKLQVVSGVSAASMTLGSATGVSQSLNFDTTGWGMYFGVDSTTGNGWIQQGRTSAATAYNLSLQAAGGNVGVGTTTPNRLFTAQGALNVYNPTDTAWDLNILDQLVNVAANNAFFGGESGQLFSTAAGTAGGVFGKFWGSGNYNDGRLGFATANSGTLSVKMVVDGSGSVTIGTTTPSYPATKLTLVGYDGEVISGNPAADTLLRLVNNGSAVSMSLVGGSGNPSTIYFGTTGANGNTTGRIVYNNNSTLANGSMAFYTANNERLRIDGSGNVGIGDTAPQAKLEIAVSSSGAVTDALVLTNPNSSAVNTGVALHFDPNNAGSLARTASIKSRQTTAGNWADLGFFTAPGDTPGERMTITGSGNVGIGTTTPAYKLHIQENGTAQIALSNGSGVTKAFIGTFPAFGTASNGDLQLRAEGTNIVFGSSGAEFARISSSGLVGIGTTTPNSDSMLTIQGDGSQNAATLYIANKQNNGGRQGAAIELHNADTGGSGDSGIIYSNPVATWFAGVDRDVSSNFHIYPGVDPTLGAEGINITTAGNVGIGVSPSTKLHVQGNTNGAVQSHVENLSSGSGAYSIFTLGNDGAPDLNLFFNSSARTSDGGANGATLRNDAGALSLQSNGSNGIYIAGTTGYTGIGTTSPGARLDVQGTTAGGGNNLAMRLMNGYASIGDRGDGFGSMFRLSGNNYATASTWDLYSQVATGDFRLYQVTNAAGSSVQLDRLSIDNSGNVAIGASTTPWGLLSVNPDGIGSAPAFVIGSSTKTLFTVDNAGVTTVGDAANTGDAIFQLAGDTNAWAMGYNSTSKAFQIASSTNLSGSPAFTILKGLNGNGLNNVGVATTTPWRQFSVSGTVGFDGLTSSTGAGSLCLSSTKQVVYNSGTDACLTSLRDTKHDIAPLAVDALAQVRALQSVSFIYNDDAQNAVRYGFIAEDAEAVDSSLATHNEFGTITGIDDRAILSLLVAATQTIDARTRFIASATSSRVLTVDADGNVGIGTTTPAYMLQVAGDVAATGFVNASTRNLKTNINYASPDAASSTLAALQALRPAAYEYTYDAAHENRFGLIAEDVAAVAPEILSADGKGVDLYKLATFTLSGVQALAARVDAQEMRIASLEERVIALQGAAPSSGASTSPIAALAEFGVRIERYIANFIGITTESLTVGSTSTPAGITLYDRQTGLPHCVTVENGAATTTAGACTTVELATTATSTTGAPIALLGDNPIRLVVGDTFTDPGVVVASGAPVTVYLNGLAEPTVPLPIDTSAPATHIITYSSSDSAGQTVTTIRAVIVSDAADMPPEEPGAGTGSSDVTPPVVTLSGSAAVEITVGDAWTDPGATATDDTDGDLTASIVVLGSVDIATLGLYTLTYSATDAAGNTGSISRVVGVIDATDTSTSP